MFAGLRAAGNHRNSKGGEAVTTYTPLLPVARANSDPPSARDGVRVTQAQVTDFMCSADITQVVEILRAVSEAREGFIEQAVSQVQGGAPPGPDGPIPCPLNGSTPSAMPPDRQETLVVEEEISTELGDPGQLCRRPSRRSEADTPLKPWSERLTKKRDIHRPCVQFSSPQYYCSEEEDAVTLQLMRFEPFHKRCAVMFRTVDATAKAGKHYEPVCTEVVFEPDQTHREVRVPLIRTPEWSTLLEFRVELGTVEGEDVELGCYLWHARVMDIDTDAFPSNKFTGVPIEDVSVYALVYEYQKLVRQLPRVRSGTLKGLAQSAFCSFSFLTKLLLNVLLVDSILNLEYDDANFFFGLGREDALVAMTMLLVLLFALEHLLEYLSTTWGVGGSQRLLLQKSAMRKYMSMGEEHRRKYNSADLVTLMTRDAPKIVSIGYNSIFALAQEIGNIIAILAFHVVAKFAFQKKDRPIAIVPMLVTPMCLCLFAALRAPATDRSLAAATQKQDALVDVVFDACENYDLIDDFKRKPYFVQKLEDSVKDFHGARRAARQRMLNNEQFAPWVSQVFIAVYLVIGGINVIEGRTSLGMFLTNCRVMQEFGATWSRIYINFVDIAEVGPSLARLTRFLNVPTDSLRKMTIKRHQQQASAKASLKHIDESNEFMSSDRLCITCRNPLFPMVGVRMRGCLEIAQGEFVSIFGAHGSGASSLMTTLGGRWLPHEKELHLNSVFIPAHLRILHVGSPLFFDESLMKNLTFGVEKGHPDGDPERVRAICRLLKVEDRIIDMLDEPCTKPWRHQMATTDGIKLHMARAFIANPEILLVHKPTDMLRHASADAMMAAFRDYVADKGLLQDPSRWLYRRPRTCVITCCREADVKYIDKAYFIDSTNTIHLVEPGNPLPSP